MHKYGFHVNRTGDDVFDAIARIRPRVIKTLAHDIGFWRSVRDLHPDVFLIGRLYVPNQEQDRFIENPAAAGRAFAERILQLEANRSEHHGRHLFDAWESYNEVFPEAVEPARKRAYDDFQTAFAAPLQAQGFEPIAMNFATGNMLGNDFLDYFPGTLATYRYLGFHEYDWPTLWRLHEENILAKNEGGMWLALRYRRIMDAVRRVHGDRHTVLITECGMTQGVQGGDDVGPWDAARPVSEQSYWDSLMWYNDELLRDDCVMAACLFVVGAVSPWHTFEHLGGIINRLERLQTGQPPAVLSRPAIPTSPAERPIPVDAPPRPSPAPVKTVAPTPVSHSGEPMRYRTCRIGVHGRNDHVFSEDDFRVIRETGVEAVKMMSQTDPAVFKRIKEINPDIEIITRLYDDRIGHGHPTAAEFADRMAPVMAALQPYCAKFQIANEPNHVQRYEGWGPDDADARDFNQWFLEVYALLKQACPWAGLGFPGLAIPDFAHRDRAWLEICRPAVQRADWLGVHCYWQTPPDRPSVMLDDHFGLTFKYYHALYPDKTLEILECGNSNIHNPQWPISEDDIAREYVAWLQEVFTYPYINSASFFLLSSPDRASWDFFAWRTESNFVKPVAHAIASMHRPPRQPAPGTTAAIAQPAQPPPVSAIAAASFTHNQIIDAFYDASVKLGLGDWTLLERAGLSLDALVQERTAVYAGPLPAQLATLTDAERQAVLHELADFAPGLSFGPPSAKPQGWLWQRPDLALVRPAIPPSRRVSAPPRANALERRVARVWNDFGWLLIRLAEQTGLDLPLATAALAVQSSARAFGEDRRPVLRFEAHLFHHHWGERNQAAFDRHFRFSALSPWQQHRWRPAPDQPWQDVHSSHSSEWGAFEQAAALDEQAALLSTAMGLAQILGANHALAGFESPGQMFDAFMASARCQVLAFFDLLGGPRGDARPMNALRRGDVDATAALLSGSAQAARTAALLHAALDAYRRLGLAQ